MQIYLFYFNKIRRLWNIFYKTHVSGDMSFDEFEKICRDAWSEGHGYIVLNLWEECECGRYLLNYNKIYTP